MKRSRLNDGSLTNESNYVNLYLHLLFFMNNDFNFLFYSQTLPLNLDEHQDLWSFFFYGGEKPENYAVLFAFFFTGSAPTKLGVYGHPHAINMKSSVTSFSCSLSDPDSCQKFI